MRLYREVKASERLPEERTEVHIINSGLLSSAYIQDEQWYLGEHETPVLKFSGIWLEPIEITEEEIHKIANQYVIIDSEGLPDEEVPYFTMEGARAILSKLKGE